MMFPGSKRVTPIPSPQSFEFCKKHLSCSCFEEKRMSSAAGNSKETSVGSKRRRRDRVIGGVLGSRGKRRKMEGSSLLKAPTEHPVSGRVFNQPWDPKVKEKPMDDEKRSRPDGVIVGIRGPRGKRRRRMDCSSLLIANIGIRGPRGKRGRRMDCCSLLIALSKHPVSARVSNQPLDPKVNEKPMDDEKRSRPDGVIVGFRCPRVKRRRKMDCSSLPMDDEIISMISQPLSPKKASRAVMLKSRYADNILKSQQQKNIVDPVKTKQEKETLERRLAEEKAKIRAAEFVEKIRTKVGLKKQRERERKAARIALQMMERTAGIELNLETFKELDILSGCSLSRGKPLHDLGLFIKAEYLGDDDEEEAILYEDVEEGEILPNTVPLDHDNKADPSKAQQEKEKLERIRLVEEKTKIKADESAAKKKTEVELTKQREREREAARIALEKMERTAGIELNLEIYKELEILYGCSLSRGNPLHELGLFIKQEYLGDDDEENLEVEHGKILNSRLEVVDGSRKNCSKAQPSRNSSNSPKKSKSSKEKAVKVALNARVAEKCATLTSQMSKFYVPNSGERLLTPISDVQMSPKKASRAAMLRSRYADIIMKSQQEKNIIDPVKTQLKKEKLERRLAEDKPKTRVDEAAAKKNTKVELKKQRETEREREAARIALQKMEGTAGIESNLETFKELEILSGYSLSRGKPLQQLGLFIKHEYSEDYHQDEALILYEDVEEGEILP